MQVLITPNGDLKITCDAVEREQLRRNQTDDPDHFVTDKAMRDELEWLVTNHEYQWTEPAYCGALTDAPMLATYSQPRPLNVGEDPYFINLVGRWHNANGVLTTWVEDVETCWGYMDYQLRSPLEDLTERGECVFQRG